MLARVLPEFDRVRDRYLWLTGFIIARNAITREYQNSFLGMMWTVILPLIQVVIFAIIMPFIMARPVANYPLYLVASFPLWAFISAAMVQSCSVILNQAETIKRCIVSPVVFSLAEIMKQFYTYLVSFGTMYAFCLVFYVDFDPAVLLLPLLLVPVFITLLALGIAISFVAPYVRDIGYVMHMLINILFWFTPVVYPVSVVPEPYQWVFWLNPFYVLMHPVQQLIFAHTLPGAGDVLGMAAVTLVALVLSCLCYRACRRNYVYYL